MAETAGAGGGAQAAAPLDDVMLAMDVVDNLRHADRLVERELGAEERDRQMKERLRRLYAAQGIDVPEHILDEGVAALREDRFTYRAPAGGLSRMLALAWVRRGRWLKRVAIAAGVVVVLAVGWYVVVTLPAEQRTAHDAREIGEILPQQIRTEVARIAAISKVADATQQARALATDAEAAVRAGDAAAARQKVAQLTALRETLEQSYVLRIVSRPGEKTGVWRVPKQNPSGRNYYVVVDAIDARGNPVPVTVTSEETNRTARASTFGIRVDARTFDRIRADKQDDGIIQNNRFGEKAAGYLEPRYAYPTSGGAILEW